MGYICNTCHQVQESCSCIDTTYRCVPPCNNERKCETILDTDCIKYGYNNPTKANGISCLGLPVGTTTLTAFMEKIDSKICRLVGVNIASIPPGSNVTDYTTLIQYFINEIDRIRTQVNHILGSCCTGSTTSPATTTSTTTVPAASTSTTTNPPCQVVTNLIASVTGTNLQFVFTGSNPPPSVNYTFALIKVQNSNNAETVIYSGSLPNTYSGVVQTVNILQTIVPIAGFTFVFRVTSQCGAVALSTQANLSINNTTSTSTTGFICAGPRNAYVEYPGTTTTTSTTSTSTTSTPWLSTITWNYNEGTGAVGVFDATRNGVSVAHAIVTSNGSFTGNPGHLIQVSLSCGVSNGISLTVVDDLGTELYNQSAVHPSVLGFSFNIASGRNYTITAISTDI